MGSSTEPDEKFAKLACEVRLVGANITVQNGIAQKGQAKCCMAHMSLPFFISGTVCRLWLVICDLFAFKVQGQARSRQDGWSRFIAEYDALSLMSPTVGRLNSEFLRIFEDRLEE